MPTEPASTAIIITHVISWLGNNVWAPLIAMIGAGWAYKRKRRDEASDDITRRLNKFDKDIQRLDNMTAAYPDVFSDLETRTSELERNSATVEDVKRIVQEAFKPIQSSLEQLNTNHSKANEILTSIRIEMAGYNARLRALESENAKK